MIIKNYLFVIIIHLIQNQLRDEVKCYRDYLASQAEEEKNKEKELDALLNEEVQKQWAKRVNQWRS